MQQPTNERPLFISQCRALISTLEQAKKAEQSLLNMELWITHDSEDNESGHFCNSVACICGYQALAGDFTYFPQTCEMGDGANRNTLAVSISDDLDAACKAIFGDKLLAQSIFEGGIVERLHNLGEFQQFHNVPNSESLNELPHLNLEKPSFDEAIEYLNAVIDVTNEYIVQQEEVS